MTLRKFIESSCSLLAAVALFAIMWLTLLDVSGRKLLSESIPGSLELTELLMVVVIFAGLPLVSLRGEHVVFDSLDAFMPAGLLRAQRALIDGLCALALGWVGWLMWVKGSQMLEYGDKTQQLGLTLGYVRAPDERAAVRRRGGAPAADAGADGASPPGRRRRRIRMIEALIGFGVIFALALLRVPLAFAMGAVGYVGLGLLRGWDGHRGERGAGGLRHRLRLHAVGGAAVHPDGQLRRPRRAGERAVPRGLHLHRPCARRAGACHHHRLRRLRRDLRLVHRHRGDDVQGGLPVDAAARLCRLPVHRRHRRRRHAGHHDSAVHHHGDLRHRHRDQHRQALRRGRAAGPAVRADDDGRRVVDHLARPVGRPGGRALHLEGALHRAARHLGRGAAGGGGAGRHLRRHLHRHRRRGHRRVRRLLLRLGARQPDAGRCCTRCWWKARAPRRCSSPS